MAEEMEEVLRKQQQTATTSSHNNNNTNNSMYYSEEDGEGIRKRPRRACRARTWARLAATPPTPPTRPRPQREREREQRGHGHRPLPNNNNNERERERGERGPPLEFPSTVPPSDKERCVLRNMWELASILNFLNVFRPVLNINVEFTVEELETALITANDTLDMIHIPLLKGIPPISRTALRRDTWVTVLCKKLKYWWPWVAEGELPLIAHHGEEIAMYKRLDPGLRAMILKALCDIRVEQDDIRKYIDDSLKHGIQLLTFRKERIAGSVNGTSYWYEDDSTIGHRLYREIRKIELKTKPKGRGRMAEAVVIHQWETIATSLEGFQAVSEKLISSRNKAEIGLGKKIQNDILPTLEDLQKRKERALKRQQREANLLDSFLTTQGVATGRSRRDRKPVTYTFDEYDRSINEAIRTTKKSRLSPEPVLKSAVSKNDHPANFKGDGRGRNSDNGYLRNADNGYMRNSDNGYTRNSDMSSKFREESGESDAEYTSSPLARSNRQRRRSQRYSEKEYVEAYYDEEADFDSDDDIVGEAVYDDEYFKIRKHAKVSSNSDSDEEYRGDEDVTDAGDDEYASVSEDVENSPNYEQGWSASGRQRRDHKRKFADELQSGLRRSKRATRIDYSKYEMSDSDEEHAHNFERSARRNGQMNVHKEVSNSGDSIDYDTERGNPPDDVSDQMRDEKQHCSSVNAVESPLNKTSAAEMLASSCKPILEGSSGQRSRFFLDLNEAAPLGGFDDGPSTSGRDQMEVDDIGHLSSRQ